MVVILKIGGSVITDRKSDTPLVNYENLKRIAEEISAYRGKLILIHGAGSYGHQIVKRTGIGAGIKTGQNLVDFAETQRLQNVLNAIVCEELIKRGVPAIPLQASASAVMNRGRLVSLDTAAISGLLEIGMVPVLYGVPAYDEAIKCSILSGDQIAPFLAKRLNASRIIHGTNVDGVYTSDPNKDKDAKLIPIIGNENIGEVKAALSGSTNVDVTGGMFSKVNELLGLSVESVLVNAEKPGYLKKALLGEEVVCTVIK